MTNSIAKGWVMENLETRNMLQSLALAYLHLGGQRRGVVDDNHISTRLWHAEPPEADLFWQDYVAGLEPEALAEFQTFLPTINRI